MSETPNILTSAEQEIFNKTIDFLRVIGIPVHFRPINDKTLLPGIQVLNGEIIVDMEQLKYPGDILHEAGHIAVVPAAERNSLNEDSIGEREQNQAEEMAAIAWSYAACVHLDVDATFVLHDQGYKSGGNHLANNFKAGRYFGVPMLQWTGMALDPKEPGGYPEMRRWMRE